MAYTRTNFLVLILIFICFATQFSEARKLLVDERKELAYSLRDSLLLSALPKGFVPSSSPRNQAGATMIGNEQQSVPSPGIGH